MSEITRIHLAEHQLQSLMDCSERSELVQSVRLLALYVAAYKEQYGELDNVQLQHHLLADAADPATMRIFESGLHEAIAILSMIRVSGTGNPVGEGENVLLN